MAGLTLVSRAGLLAAPCPLSCPASIVQDVPTSFPAQGDCLCQFCTSEVNWGQAGPAGLCHLSSSTQQSGPCLCTAALSQVCHHHIHAVAPADTSKPLEGSGVTPSQAISPRGKEQHTLGKGGPVYSGNLQPYQVKPKPRRGVWMFTGGSGCRCDSGMDPGAGICSVDLS